MYDPHDKIMRPVPVDETAMTAEQRTWTKFDEGEIVSIKGINMRVHEIGESRLVLKFK